MHEHLRKKGWTQKEIEHLFRHFTPTKEEKIVVIIALLLKAFAVFAVPYGYALIGQYLTTPVFYITLIMIGTPLGAAFGLLLTDLDLLTHKHHIGFLITVPIIIIGASFYTFTKANNLATEGFFIHNALIGGITYAIAFITPYAFLVKQEWNSKIGRWNTSGQETPSKKQS